LGVLHVGLTVGGELGLVVAGDTSVVDENLDALGLFFAQLVVEALDVVLLAVMLLAFSPDGLLLGTHT
jgi:hypothetical protein